MAENKRDKGKNTQSEHRKCKKTRNKGGRTKIEGVTAIRPSPPPSFGGGRPPLRHPHSLAVVRLHPPLSALVSPRSVFRWSDGSGVGVLGDGPRTGQFKVYFFNKEKNL